MGYRYKQFRSSGGCCDCGDEEGWKREGFCANHSRTCADPLKGLGEHFLANSGAVIMVGAVVPRSASH